MRKILFLFSIIFLFFFSACDTQKDTKRHLSFSTWGSQSEIKTIKFLIEKFEEKNPDIKINLIHIPDNYFQKLHLLIASNLSPDVIFINNINSRIYVKAGKLENLNSYIKKSRKIFYDDFFTNSVFALSYNDFSYAIPRDISNLVIYYNKDLFDKYSISYPQKNWSLNDFLVIAQKLTHDTNNDGKIDIFGFGYEEDSLFWLPFLWSNGGGIISSDSGEIILNKKNSKDALQFYIDLRNKYHVSPKADEQSSLTTSQLFMQQKVAMHLCGRWCSLTYKKNANFNWDVVNFPKGKNGSVVDLDVSGWAISSSSKNKNDAWRFIEFMASEEAMYMMTQNGLILPARKSVAASNVFLESPPSNAKAFLYAIDNAVSTPVCVKYQEILDILDVNFESLFNGKSSVDDIINIKLIEKLSSLTD